MGSALLTKRVNGTTRITKGGEKDYLYMNLSATFTSLVLTVHGPIVNGTVVPIENKR